MPELPEVETMRIGLLPLLQQPIRGAWFSGYSLRTPFSPQWPPQLIEMQATGLARWGKYLGFSLANATQNTHTLILHPGMSGRISLTETTKEEQIPNHGHLAGKGVGLPEKHDHLLLAFDRHQLRVNDPRRFGRIALVEHADLAEWIRHTHGDTPDWLSFPVSSFVDKLATRRVPLKAALLDQKIAAGVGNIYACEALFAARLSPFAPAHATLPAERERLHASVSQVLQQAIASGGSSLKDYRKPDGELGYFQHAWQVYGRAGEPCKACGTLIERAVQSGRSTFLCPNCQPVP